MPIPAGLIVLAASALAKHANDQEALHRQEQIRQAMEAYQKGKSRQAVAATEEVLKKQTPEERGTELNQVTGDREKSLRETVGAAQAFDAPATAGAYSDSYRAAQEKEASTIAERTRRAIVQLATMGAPGEQRQKQQLRFGKAAGDVDAANSASANVGQAYLTDINNVRPSPIVDLASQVGMAVGSGMMASPGSAATTGASSADAMGADSAGHFTYEDSVGNTQRSAIPYQQRQQQMRRGFSLWGRK